MRRLLDPKVLLALASLAVVVLLALRDARDPGPGPLHSTHAQVTELRGRDGCDACHGTVVTGRTAAEAMAAACNACHTAIETQCADGTGFHGQLADGGLDCAFCHGEHHGDELLLVSDAAFERAGFAGAATYDHTGLGFGLVGRHVDLACDACHERAETPVLGHGQARYLGLVQECTACHEDPHDGTMELGCAECHGQSEPFANVAAFEHTPDFPLVEPHAGLACNGCHAPNTPHEIEELQRSDAAAARACADCHQEGHSAGFLARVDTSCETCHGTPGVGATIASFAEADRERTFELHGASGFVLEAAHARVDCNGCHAKTGTFEERFPGRAQDDCAACHADAHGDQFDSPPARTCVDCHDSHAFTPSLFGASQHARTGLPLDGAHARASCNACHDAPADDTARAFRGLDPTCSACHDDVHGGAFEAMARTDDCAQCHDTHAFRPTRNGAFDHGAATGFALAGAHGTADCQACHGPATTDARTFGFVGDVFAGDTGACATCHQNPHGERFAAAGDAAQLDCARCHTSTSFLDVSPNAFDHGAETGFALEGSHSWARCTACHVPAEGDGTTARLGRVTDTFPGPIERCDTCHADAHGGLFEAPGRPRSADGVVGCARCHTPATFRRTAPFEHTTWTGWSLTGAHASLDCTACHAAQPEDALGRTTGYASGRACADCHADPHLGQFTLGKDGCARCHTSTERFADFTFDHDTARFALDEKHARLDCSACHVTTRTRDGREAIRFKPIPHDCIDCHDPNGGGDRR